MKINSFLLRCTLIAALGGFLFGFETAVISGAEKTIQQLWSLSDFLLGFTVAASLIGTVIGSMIAGKPAQRYGRKKVLMAIALMYLVSAIGCSLTPTWILFIIFRMVGGIAVGASSVVGPMYISEISPAAVRGRLTGMFQLNIVIGILVAFLTNFAFLQIGAGSWRWMVGVMVIPAGLFALLLRVIPESPRWLILNNRDEEAALIFARTGEPDGKTVINEEHALLSGEERSFIMLLKKNYSVENSASPFFMPSCSPCLTSFQVLMRYYIMHREFLKWPALASRHLFCNRFILVGPI